MSQLIVLIKPWCVEYAEDIFAELGRHGTRLKTAKVEEVPLEVIAQHYEAHQGEEYYKPMIDDLAGKPIVVALYEGDRKEFERLKEEIRTKYAPEIPLHPVHQRSALHTSVTEEESLHEINVWAAYLK